MPGVAGMLAVKLVGDALCFRHWGSLRDLRRWIKVLGCSRCWGAESSRSTGSTVLSLAAARLAVQQRGGLQRSPTRDADAKARTARSVGPQGASAAYPLWTRWAS